MGNVTRKGLWARKRRLVGTTLAVFIGIAFLSGTLVLGDTLRANFAGLFSGANAGTDAVVRSTSSIQADGGRGPGAARRRPVPTALADRLRAVPGVAAAAPSVEGFGELLGADGRAVGTNGPPRLVGNWVDVADLNPYRLVEGRAPQADDEVVVNRGAAKAGKLHVGQRTTVQTPDPVPVTVVGIATFGTEDGFGSSTFTAFSLHGAEVHVAAQPGQATRIAIKGAPGVSQAELVARIAPVLGEGVEAVEGARYTKESTDALGQRFLNVFTTFLTVFAGIALLVAGFSIFNTFSILVAQRSREAALLRAIGAARAQIVGSVAVEALAVGVLASAAGLAGGVAVAGLLKGLFDAVGFSLPAGGLVFSAGTALVGMVVGTAVTLLAAVVPAVRASRVAPVAALRETAAEPAGASVARAVTGLVLTATGVLGVLGAVLGRSSALARAGLGALLVVVGLVVLGPLVARPVAGVIGWPLRRLRGVTGALAGQNAMRNPRRTSSTASALMVGVGVVTLFTVFAASIRTSVDDSVSKSFGGDLVVNTSGFGRGGLSPRLAGQVAALPQVQVAVGLGQGLALVDGGGQRLTVADLDQLAGVLDLTVRQGSLRDLGPAQLAVSKKRAAAKGWGLGAGVPVTFVDGTTTTFTVGAIYDGTEVAGDHLVTRAGWAPHADQDVDSSILVKLRPGVGLAAGRSAVEQVTAAVAGVSVQDSKAYAASVTRGVDTFLGVVYVLLLLAILIALMGIANTLSLAVHERSRELGLLRAVGLTRAQVRAMVRWESVIIAVFGTVGGLGLGLFLGWALVHAASTDGALTFTAPMAQLAVVLAAGAVAGVLAGYRPARRAARTDILTAIGTG